MISKEMLQRGYDNGGVKLISSPNEDGVVCSIGGNWFYFDGTMAEDATPESYAKMIPKQMILAEIFAVLQDFYKDGEELREEYDYYEAVLIEQGC